MIIDILETIFVSLLTTISVLEFLNIKNLKEENAKLKRDKLVYKTELGTPVKEIIYVEDEV